MSRRVKVRWISYSATLLVCFVAALIACFTGAKRYENRINADTSRALGAAVDAVGELDCSLKKSACAVTPAMENVICTDIYSNAKQVEAAFSVLPVKSASLEQMAKHVAVVGDYAAMLSRANAEGERFTESALQQLAQFSETTSTLYDALVDLQQQIADGTLSNEQFHRITDALDNLEPTAASAAATMESQMETIAAAFPELPELIYDGMYTDQADRSAKLLAGQSACTENEARTAAANWLGCDENKLDAMGEIEAEIPYYCFVLQNKTDPVRIAITKNGAETLWMMGNSASGDASLSPEEAEKQASGYLRDRGFGNMEPTRVSVSGGEAQVRFASVADGDILCYPDEITVSISLVNGDTTAYNARDYVMHHTQRDLRVFDVGSEKAIEAIPAFLNIDSVRPVILSGIGEEERACYLFGCSNDLNEVYHIYVNAKTGEQELILLPDEVWKSTAME